LGASLIRCALFLLTTLFVFFTHFENFVQMANFTRLFSFLVKRAKRKQKNKKKEFTFSVVPLVSSVASV